MLYMLAVIGSTLVTDAAIPQPPASSDRFYAGGFQSVRGFEGFRGLESPITRISRWRVPLRPGLPEFREPGHASERILRWRVPLRPGASSSESLATHPSGYPYAGGFRNDPWLPTPRCRPRQRQQVTIEISRRTLRSTCRDRMEAFRGSTARKRPRYVNFIGRQHLRVRTRSQQGGLP